MKKGLVSWAGESWMEEEEGDAGRTEQEAWGEGIRGQSREWRGESIIPDGAEIWKINFVLLLIRHELSLFYMRTFSGKKCLWAVVFSFPFFRITFFLVWCSRSRYVCNKLSIKEKIVFEKTGIVFYPLRCGCLGMTEQKQHWFSYHLSCS